MFPQHKKTHACTLCTWWQTKTSVSIVAAIIVATPFAILLHLDGILPTIHEPSFLLLALDHAIPLLFPASQMSTISTNSSIPISVQRAHLGIAALPLDRLFRVQRRGCHAGSGPAREVTGPAMSSFCIPLAVVRSSGSSALALPSR